MITILDCIVADVSANKEDWVWIFMFISNFEDCYNQIASGFVISGVWASTCWLVNLLTWLLSFQSPLTRIGFQIICSPNKSYICNFNVFYLVFVVLHIMVSIVYCWYNSLKFFIHNTSETIILTINREKMPVLAFYNLW